MQKVFVTINGTEISLPINGTGNRGADIQRAAQAYCQAHDIDWVAAEVFAHHGEKGRCYQKNPSYLNLLAYA